MRRETELVARLAAIRRTVRRRLLGYGVCAVLAGGVASFLTIASLDWLLDLPWVLRLFVATLFLAGFAGAAWRWIIKPLRVPLTLDVIAGQLERRFPTLGDELSSAISFTQRNDPGSPAMVAEVIARAERTVRSLRLTSALSVRPLVKCIAWLAVSAAVLAGVIVVVPVWARTGLVRYLDPLGDVEWPRTVSIRPLTGDLTAAVGESLDVRMVVRRGLTDSLRAMVHVREPDQTASVLTMRREDDGAFSATIDALTRDLEYWFEAGDDTTARRPFRIRVVKRPGIVEAIATAHPPDYASERPVRVQDLRDGPIRAVMGATVDVMVRASKPIAADNDASPVGLRLSDGTLIPFSISTSDPTQLHAALQIEGNVSFRVELRDLDGFANRGADTYAVRAVPDTPPVVSMMEPRAMTEVTPMGVVAVVARVVDDYGVTRVRLNAARLSGESVYTRDLAIKESGSGSDSVELVARHDWRLEPLNLSPGDALSFDVRATDNRHVGGANDQQVGASTMMRLKIISQAEFEARLRGDIAVVETRLRRLALDQIGLIDRTTTFDEALSNDQPLADANRLASARTSGEQLRLVRPLRDLARRLVQFSERMERNGVGHEETRARLRAMGDSLRATAEGPVPEAGAALRRVVELTAARDQRAAIADALVSQHKALDDMQALLRSVAQWGGFHGLMARANDLLERQESLRTRTGTLGKRTLGKAIESLSPDEAASLKRASSEQTQVGLDVEEFLQRMVRERANARERDTAAVDAIDEALRAARAHELTSRLRAAAEAVEQNRTAGAMIEQKAAAKAIRKVIAALRARRDRELAELSKQLTDARDQIALLLEDQTALRDATHEAGLMNAGSTVFAALGADQRRIRLNTDAVADDLSANERTAAQATPLRRAVDAMADAQTSIHALSAGAAEPAQDRAITSLREALDDLEEQARQTENEAFRRTLAEMRERFEAIRNAQVEVNERIDNIKADVDRDGRLGRAQARRAVRVSRAQDEVRTLVDELMPELERVVVYRWALERVTDWMERVGISLYERRVDDDVVETAGRIVSEIEKLIAALTETEALPMDTDFVESGSSDGAGGQMGSTASVPAIAELLVLKTLQVDINDRTRALAKTFDADRPTESHLRRLKSVGEDQTEVRRLSEMVTQRARQ